MIVEAQAGIRVRVRLDYLGEVRTRLFGHRSNQKAAEEVREQRIALFRNVPVQGLEIEDVDSSLEVYTITDRETGREVVYAPIIVTARLDRLEDLVPFLIMEELRKLEVIEPQEFHLSAGDVQRLLVRMNMETRQALMELAKRASAR
ncbi:MAG: hypothetical protein D9V47_14185 [Clostridia bacterium]|nr:MAG: hypothetical protein D9V47_14185 [Clostridia bacterium]